MTGKARQPSAAPGAPVSAAPGAPVSVGGVSIVAPSTNLDSNSTQIAKYGLAEPNTAIYVGALGVNLGVQTDPKTGKANAIDVLNALAAQPAGSPIAAQVQSMLLNAGYYSSSATPTMGVISESDLSALAKALNVATSAQGHIDSINTTESTAAQQAGQGAVAQQEQPFDFTSNLSDQAKIGATQGVQAALTARLQTVQKLQAASAATPLTRSHYDRNAINDIADTAAESLLGRKATDEEKAAIYGNLDAKNNVSIGKAVAKAQQLDRTAAEVADANQRLNEAATGNLSGKITEQRMPGMSPIQQEQFDKGNDIPTSAGVDQFLAAMAQSGSADNPYGFTSTTWSAYARQAGLGSDATASAGNQQVVARYLAMSLFAKTGSWDAVTAGFLQGPSAATQYATHPDSAKWTQASSSGQTVAGRINAVQQALTSGIQGTSLAQVGPITLGSDTGKQTEQSIAQGLEGATSAMPEITDQTAQDPSADAAATLKAEHPDQYQAHNLANVFSSFLGLLGGIGASNSSGYGQGGAPA